MNRKPALLLALLALACNPSTGTDLGASPVVEAHGTEEVALTGELDWLIGNWKRLNEKPELETFENWEKVGPWEYRGIGFTMQEGDTVGQERMTFREADGKWSLAVELPDYEGSTVFEVTELDSLGFTCVNDSNDFPKVIQYWVDGEMLRAKISGGGPEIPYEFGRIR